MTDFRGPVVTIGKFDGVHRGHRALLQRTRQVAKMLNRPAVAVTLDRHPFATVRPEDVPPTLTPLPHKIRLLRRHGMNHVTVLTFDAARASQSAEEFVEDVLVDGLRASLVVVGQDFRFGHRAAGDVGMMHDLGLAAGFGVDAVTKVTVPTWWGAAESPAGQASSGPPGTAAPISSTAIRKAIGRGRLDDAQQMLGRRHLVAGEVGPDRPGVMAIHTECAVPPAGGPWDASLHTGRRHLASGRATLEACDQGPCLRPTGPGPGWPRQAAGDVWATLAVAA